MVKHKHPKFADEFKREAVRILQTSGRTITEVATDLDIARSTLGRWKREIEEAELFAGPYDNLHMELTCNA